MKRTSNTDKDENDLVFIVWSNANKGRPFETMTKHGSRLPVAWRLSFLETKYKSLFKSTHLVSTKKELENALNKNIIISKDEPLLIPVSYAKTVLGWQDYTVWDSEHD